MCAYTKEEWARVSKKASIAHILELGLRLFDESWQVPKTILGGRLINRPPTWTPHIQSPFRRPRLGFISTWYWKHPFTWALDKTYFYQTIYMIQGSSPKPTWMEKPPGFKNFTHLYYVCKLKTDELGLILFVHYHDEGIIILLLYVPWS